jgi:hypothetical protein
VSNYRNKKKKGVRVASKRLGDPVFQYNCHCHDVKASKKPCIVDSDTQFSDRNKLEHSLGTWTCAITRKSCKVNRTRNKQEETEQVSA